LFHKTQSAFRSRITPKGNETFEADWRQRAHDDMVLAVGIAVWLGEKLGAAPGRIDGPLMMVPPEPGTVPEDEKDEPWYMPRKGTAARARWDEALGGQGGGSEDADASKRHVALPEDDDWAERPWWENPPTRSPW
jgi:hypothetical protein